MKITLGTDVSQRVEFSEFLNRCGIETVLGNDSHDYIDGIRVRDYEDGIPGYTNPERDVFQSRWMDFCKQKLNSLPDGVRYINYTYRVYLGLTNFYTKPIVCISFDTSGAEVVLGRAESVPHANLPEAGFRERLIAAVEKVHPSIQVYIEYRSHAPLVTMSRASQRASGRNESEMTAFVEETIRAIN